jgi:hypothetical protein
MKKEKGKEERKRKGRKEVVGDCMNIGGKTHARKCCCNLFHIHPSGDTF